MNGAGSCYGFSVRSSVPLQFLRSLPLDWNGAAHSLDVEEDAVGAPPAGEPVVEWPPTEDRPYLLRLYERDGGYVYSVGNLGIFRVDPSVASVAVPAGAEPVHREERLWSLPALLCFARRGDLPFHAAAVEVAGRAVLLAAPGRFGKTTLAAAFLGSGHRLLSEDLSCCRLGSQPMLFPGPAVVRIRPDVFPQMTFPGTHVVAVDRYRYHLALDHAVRGDGAAVPIVGVVFIRPEYGKLEVRPAAMTDAVRDLWALSFDFKTDPAGRALRFQQIVDMASQVSLWDLVRPPGIERLREAVEAIVEVVATR